MEIERYAVFLQLQPSIVVTNEEFEQISSIVQALQVVQLII